MKSMVADTSFDQLTATARGRRLFEQEFLLVSATELISGLMQKKKVSRSKLAERIGKSKSFVTQILRGQHNMTLRTLADLAWALDARVHLQDMPWEAEIQSPRGMIFFRSSWASLESPFQHFAETQADGPEEELQEVAA